MSLISFYSLCRFQTQQMTSCGLVCLDPPKTHPVMALVSYPGSGNTWLRHLIELTTGVFTGSVYSDKVLHKGGFLGELQNHTEGTTLLVKTHKLKTIPKIKGNGAILLIRNPFKAFVAEFKRIESRGGSRVQHPS